MKTCPPCLEWREKLALRHEDLSPADQQALDAHVQHCKACAQALADYHFFEARLDALPPPSIKPLPRLSPRFFEQSTEEHGGHKSSRQPGTPTVDTTARLATRRPDGKMAPAWRILGVAALLCLLLGAAALFQQVYQTRVASHLTGNTVFSFNQHTDLITSAAWSPDGRYIVTGSFDHTARVWNAASGNLVCTYQADDVIYAVAWSPNSQLIASESNNAVHIWNAANCSENTNYAVHTESGSIMSVAWSPNGQNIASGGWDRTADIWNITSGKTLFTIPFSDVVSSLAWSPNGQEIAASSWNNVVQIWNTRTAQPFRTYSNYFAQAVNAVAWSPNGHYLAVGNNNSTVEVVDIVSDTIICDYAGHSKAVNAVAWSPDGQSIASGSDDGTVRIWNPFSLTTPTQMVYTGHTTNVGSVAWSPNGKEIVSGDWNGIAKVWKVV